MTDRVLTWCGQDIHDMTKEQLVMIVRDMVHMLEEEKKSTKAAEDLYLDELINRKVTSHSFLSVLAATAVAVPVGFAIFFGFLMWPSLVFGYDVIMQWAWMLFVFVVFTAFVVWYDEDKGNS